MYIHPTWMVCMCSYTHTHTIHIGHTHTQLPSSRLDSYTSVLPLCRTHICTTLQTGHTCTYHSHGRVHTCTYYHMIITVEGGIHMCACVLCGGCVRVICGGCVWMLSIVCVLHGRYACSTWRVHMFVHGGR